MICTAGRPHCVERLLAAVAEQTRAPDEVLVVDGSAGPTAERNQAVAAEASIAVRYVRVEPAQRGLTRQRNRGIAEMHTDVVAFLDDDTVPSAGYFEELERRLLEREDAVGVGGWIDDGLWQRIAGSLESAPSDLAASARFRGGRLRIGDYERPLGARWRLRRALGLVPPFEPGRIPPEGHGWPVSFVPPIDAPIEVDCLMGGASAWRRTLFDHVQFSPWFDGYGLYEDQDFSIRARRRGALVLCPTARLDHLHEPSARPRAMHYGRMVVCNGWRVWRTANPKPALGSKMRWWLVTLVLLGVRASNVFTGPSRRLAAAETWGRWLGVFTVLVRGVPLDQPAAGGGEIES